jgi:oxygen-independent coproporphyrinogen-3 oxidase
MAPGGEYSIEVDPRTVNAQRLALLAELGFNRLSFGVQDFDPDVQKAVHRIQPAEQVFAWWRRPRDRGFDSINVDLIYGLPRQTPESFDRTLAQVQQLRPDRIALYAYAHLPERFKPQRRIHGRNCRRRGQGGHAVARSLAAFLARAMCMWAWTTLRCPTTRWPWPSARAGCTATSRATARSPTAT